MQALSDAVCKHTKTICGVLANSRHQAVAAIIRTDQRTIVISALRSRRIGLPRTYASARVLLITLIIPRNTHSTLLASPWPLWFGLECGSINSVETIRGVTPTFSVPEILRQKTVTEYNRLTRSPLTDFRVAETCKAMKSADARPAMRDLPQRDTLQLDARQSALHLPDFLTAVRVVLDPYVCHCCQQG
jgi:hypothetical protein